MVLLRQQDISWELLQKDQVWRKLQFETSQQKSLTLTRDGSSLLVEALGNWTVYVGNLAGGAFCGL